MIRAIALSWLAIRISLCPSDESGRVIAGAVRELWSLVPWPAPLSCTEGRRTATRDGGMNGEITRDSTPSV
jgi:hypothetical protein